jgi:hypothetical protein
MAQGYPPVLLCTIEAPGTITEEIMIEKPGE